MILSLQGKLTEVDKFNRLIFRFMPADTIDKLNRHCIGSNKPFSDDMFIVKLPKQWKIVPSDITAKIGLECNVKVKLKPFKFKSKLEYNFGTEVTGHQLMLVDISIEN